MLDLLTKKGNCTIFAVKIKAWNSWVETTQPICAFFLSFFAKTVFFIHAAYNQLYFGCAVVLFMLEFCILCNNVCRLR